MRVLEARNLGFRYPHPNIVSPFRGRGSARWALDDVSFDVERGDTFGVIGRNGSGKSTLLRLLAGILEPDAGVIEAFGHSRSLLALQVGFVPYLSGTDNVFMSGLLLGSSRAEIRRNLDAIIDFSELRPYIEDPVYTYSTGMKARLGFAIAYHLDPDIILIDETLGVGDGAFRAKSTRAMKDRVRSDKTAILVSHSHDVVRELCNRAIWIENGRTVQVGAVESVLSEYERSLK
jgi:lipopolysaccharide transport system ATP-binding protein